MATGTGLPEVKGGPVLAQAPGGTNADSLFNAQSWSQIAAAGDKLGDAAFASLKVTEHQAKVGYLADQDVEITRKRIELSNQFANEPEGSQKFQAAWDGYSEGKLSAADPNFVGHIRARLGQEGNTAYSALLSKQTAQIERQSNESWNALESSAANDVTGSAMAGTLNTPEGQVKIARYRSILESGVSSRFIVQAEADRRGGSLESTAFVYANRDNVQKTFNAEGPIAAARKIDDITRDESLSLTPEQRFSLGARLRADVHAWDAERQQNLSSVDLEANALLTAKKGGVAVPESRISEAVERYKRFGGQDKAASFLADIQHADQLSFLNRAPVADAAAWVNQYSQARGFSSPPQAAKTAMDFFVSRGWSREQAAGIVGNLVHESGLNPNATHDVDPKTGQPTGLGIAGHRLERRQALIEFARAKGAAPNDYQTQLEFIDQELRTTEASAGNALRAARTPQEAAAAFVNFERPLGYDPKDLTKAHGYSNRVGQAVRLAGGALPPAVASDVAFLGKANAVVSKRVSDQADVVVENMKKDVLPTQAAIDDLVTAAASTNNPDVLQKVSVAAGEYQFRRQFGRAPLPDEQAALGEYQRKAQTDGLDQVDARRLEMAREIVQQTTKRLEEDPLSHTMSAMGDTTTLPTPGKLDVGNSTAFVSGLKERAQWAAMGTRTFQTSAMPAVTAAEATQIRGALDAADPAGKARIYRDINSLPPATRAATLTKIADSKGAGGMIEAFAGSMFGIEPAVGESIIRGQQAMKVKDTFNLEKSSNSDAAIASLDKALPPGTFSLAARSDPKGAYATMRGAVIARAADIANTDPNFKGEFTDSIIQRAVNDVTGGIVSHNGAPAIAPIRGMTQRQFDARMWGLKDTDLIGVTTQSGAPITPGYIRDNAQLESIADGRYLIRLGRDAEKPIYAFRDVGAAVQGRMRPFVLDLRGISPDTTKPDPFSLAMPLP